MKSVELEFNGGKYSLLYNGAAMFAVNDAVGGGQVFDRITKDFNVLCTVLQILSEQGELARRYAGHDPGAVLDTEEFRVLASPVDAAQATQLVYKAVLSGMGREIEEEKPKQIDEGLLELEKKTGGKSRKRTT